MSSDSSADMDDFMAGSAITQLNTNRTQKSLPFQGYTYTIKSKYKELHAAILALSSISSDTLYIEATGKGLVFLCRNEGRTAFGKIGFDGAYFSSIYEGGTPAEVSSKSPLIVKMSMKRALKAFKISIGEARYLNYLKIMIDPNSDILTLKCHYLNECVTTMTIGIMDPSKSGFLSKCDEKLLKSRLSIAPHSLIKSMAHIKNEHEEIIFMVDPDSFAIKRGISNVNPEDENVICGSKSFMDKKMFAKFNVAERSLFYVDSHELKAFMKLANGYNSLLELLFLNVGSPFILRANNNMVVKAEFHLSTDEPRCEDDDINDFINSSLSTNVFQSIAIVENKIHNELQLSTAPLENDVAECIVTKSDIIEELVRAKRSLSQPTDEMALREAICQMEERLTVKKSLEDGESTILLEVNSNQVVESSKKEIEPKDANQSSLMIVYENFGNVPDAMEVDYTSSPDLNSSGFVGRTLPNVGADQENSPLPSGNFRKRSSIEINGGGCVTKRRSEVSAAFDSQPSQVMDPKSADNFRCSENYSQGFHSSGFGISELTQTTPKIGFNIVDDVNDIVSETQFLDSSDIKRLPFQKVVKNDVGKTMLTNTNTKSAHKSLSFADKQPRLSIKLPSLFGGSYQRERGLLLADSPSDTVHNTIPATTLNASPTEIIIPTGKYTTQLKTSHSLELADVSWDFFK
uniref:DNA mismatch repair protein n=1 Tax=Rhabditophanes sp. KR3021 TaxID=114890 RepID=A0AC35TIN5_9BILA